MFYLYSENKGADQRLNCAFVFAYAKSRFLHDMAHFSFHFPFSEASSLAVSIFNKENLWLVISPILISQDYKDDLKVAVGKVHSLVP